jgi:hypothetical protein
LPVITQVEGRTRSAFVFKDGKRMWPRGWDARDMRAFVPSGNSRWCSSIMSTSNFATCPTARAARQTLAGLAAFAHARLHPSVEIILVPLDTMPRVPSGKFEQFLSLVPVDGAATSPPQSSPMS